MRRGNLITWLIIVPMAMILLKAPEANWSSFPLQKNTKIYQVLLMPICNPGSVCNPKTPKELDYSFFSHPNSVRAFIQSESKGHVFLSGLSTPWLKPKRKLRSKEEIIERIDEIIELASDQIALAPFDFFFIYTTVNMADQQEISWPSGQIIKTRNAEYHPGLALMINSEIYQTPSPGHLSSAIVPGTAWAIEFLRMVGLRENAHALHCKDEKKLTSCHLRNARDPFSIMGLGAFSLALNWSMKRSLSWASSSDILTINKNGLYRLSIGDILAPQALEVILPQSLKLNESISFDRIFIEPKITTPFDRLVRKLHSKDILHRFTSTLDQHQASAFLYLTQIEHGTEKTVSIDTKSNTVKSQKEKNTNYLIEMADAPLLPGQNFKVFDSSVIIKLVEANNRALVIKVEGLQPHLDETKSFCWAF